MRNSRLVIAAALLALGACTGNVTGPEAAAPATGSHDVTSTTTADPADGTSPEGLDDTGLVGSGGG